MFLMDEQMKAGLAKVQTQLRATAAIVGNIGAQMTAVGIGWSLPFAAAVAVFIPFSDAMKTVGAVSQASEKDLAMLTDTAKKLGATTSFTATQVAQMMTELGRAGFNPQQVNTMTSAVMNLARASGTEAAMASGIMAATLRQFGLEAMDAAHVADVLTHAANATFNSVESLGEALKYAGPVAKSLGMSLEDTVAILGTLGNMGIQGSEAGTALRRLSVLSAAEAGKMQEVFGVAFLDAAGNARPLVDVLGDVAGSLNGLASGERIGKMNEAFGLLGITAASVMAETTSDTIKLSKELQTLQGTAAKTAAQMDSGLGGSFRRFMSGVEGVAIALAEAIEGPLAAWMEWGAAMSQELIILVKHNQGMIQTLAYIGGVVLAVGGALIGFAAAAKLVAFGIMAWTLATKAATIAQTMLLALSGPKGWAVLAAGAAIAAGAAYAVKTAYDAESKTLEAAIATNDEAAAKLGDVQQQISQGANLPQTKLLADGEPAKLDEADESMKKLIVSLAGLRGATAEVLAQQSAGDALTAIGLLGGDAAQIAAERLRKYVEDAIPPSEQLKRKLLEVDAAIAALGSNVPEGLATTLKLDVLEQSTGALSSIRELREEIALLNGTATEASQEVEAMADKGVPPEILDQYRKLREERDKLQEQQKQDEEATKAEESRLEDLRQQAQSVIADTRTPKEKLEVEMEELKKLKATLDPNTGTPLLDEETYQRALRKLHDEQLELAGRDAERLRSPKVQGNQDVRSAEGSKMLIDLLNGRNDVELKQLQAVLIANRQRANLITLTERQSTLRKASTRNS
jgi:TP901 family phage tail tape measure protein